jgi:ectoine hydroxylase-related dioxygenase (phytanoyl-CoA dioxygenase family)
LSFAVLAQDYLGSRPVLDVLTMWWHTSFSHQPDSGAGQFFHFDLDRPKWLKFFIYLTDVKPENGPHAFVAGSHRTGALPERLLSKGYSRLSDQEVGAVFAAPDVLELTAPRGSIIAEDTRGLHKGKHVLSGDRLVLQLQFSNSLYGGSYPPSQMDGVISEELTSRIGMYPRLYSAYAKGNK